MNWGKAIVLTFIVFAGFIGSLVYYMVRQRIDLVREDYYQTELAYQQQINRVSRTARLTEAPAIFFNADLQQLTVQLPTVRQSAKLAFYRPSDGLQDRSISLKPSQKVVSTAGLAKGYWRVQLSWTAAGQDYYYEQPITIP